VSTQPGWQVYLIGGASGVGKTSVSYRAARNLDVGITEIDDIHIALMRMTTPDAQPVLHFFRAHRDEWDRLTEDEKVAHMASHAEVMADPLEAVIANHLSDGPSILIEGDFLFPALAVRDAFCGVPANGRVHAAIIYEPDEQQIARNYALREGEPQPGRARISWRYSEWLRQEAARLGIPTISARPWETVLERTLVALTRR
jgi:2-phosphoglycerate kinase